MAQVPATSYESTSLGDVAEFTIPFPFLSRAEVFVTVDGAPVAFTWINDGLVQLAEVPALGTTVRRYRSTLAYVPLHQFSQGVPFLPRYVDRDFTQNLYAVQESVNDTAGTAALALDTAELALDTAQAALELVGERTQYMVLGPYAAGLNFQTTSQVFSYLGEFYAPGPSIVLPYTTTGIGAAEIANFRSVGDAVLRQDLLAASGASHVTYGVVTVQDALGRVKHLRDFGVVGDGVTSDSTAMQAVCAYSGEVIGDPGMIVMVGSLTITGSLKLDMRGGVLKFRAANCRILINADNVELKGVTFDADNFHVNTSIIRIPAGYVNWNIEWCRFKNIVGLTTTTNQYGIHADLDNAIGRVHNCQFFNISNESGGDVNIPPYAGGMLLSAADVGAQDVSISNIYCADIFCTSIAGNILKSAANAIRVFGPPATLRCNLQMRNLVFVNIQKTAIKVSGVRDIIIDGVTVYNSRSDIGMLAALRLQAADYSVVTNVNLIGRMSTGINIRSRNLIVNNVNYRPINIARDTLTAGLIQFQSADDYLTEHVTVSNVVAENVGQVFDFDLTGITVATAFQHIHLENWDITGRLTASVGAGVASRMQKAAHVKLTNVKVRDPNNSWYRLLEFTAVTQLTAVSSVFSALRDLFSWAPGCADLTFQACKFIRPDAASTENFPIAVFRDTSNGNLDRVAVIDCEVKCPTYSAVGNQHALRLYASNSIVAGLRVTVHVNGANVSPPTAWVSCSGSGLKVSDVRVGADGVVTNGSGGYAVDLGTTTTSSMVTDVMNSAGPGVKASAGANNNLISSVAAKTTAVSNTGTGNTLGTVHLLP